MRQIEAEVFKLASSLSQLKRLVEALGTPKDTVEHRRRIGELNNSIQQLSRSIKERLTSSLHAEGTSTSPEQQQKAKKLLADFASILLVRGERAMEAGRAHGSCMRSCMGGTCMAGDAGLHAWCTSRMEGACT